MLLRATTGDEHGAGGIPNATGAPYLSIHRIIIIISTSTNIVEANERVILPDLILLAIAMGIPVM
jgi:hypothetical protein